MFSCWTAVCNPRATDVHRDHRKLVRAVAAHRLGLGHALVDQAQIEAVVEAAQAAVGAIGRAIDLEAPADGALASILVPEGDSFAIGQIIATFDDSPR